MIKTLTKTLLFAAAGSLALAQSADASVFTGGGSLNITFSALQFNYAGLNTTGPGSILPGTPSYPGYAPEPNGAGTTPPNGGTNRFLDALASILNTTFVPSAGNRIMDGAYLSLSDARTSTNLQAGLDSAVGNFGQFTVGSRDGIFASGGTQVTPGSIGGIRNFDGTTLSPAFDFAEVASTGGLLQFSLENNPEFVYRPFGGNGLQIGGDALTPLGSLTATFTGRVLYTTTGDIANYTLRFSGQAIRDDGTFGDPVANDGITNLRTQSATFELIITPVAVPEPSTIALLGTAAAFGFGSRFLKRKSH